MAVPTRSDPQFKLRIPADLKDRIDQAAVNNSRSTTAEIIATLEQAYPEPTILSEEELIEFLDTVASIAAVKHGENSPVVKKLHETLEDLRGRVQAGTIDGSELLKEVVLASPGARLSGPGIGEIRGPELPEAEN